MYLKENNVNHMHGEYTWNMYLSFQMDTCVCMYICVWTRVYMGFYVEIYVWTNACDLTCHYGVR